MEDYDIFNEMKNVTNKKTIIVIENDENFIIKNLLNSNFEIMPVRFDYDLSCFSDDYIDKTKELFTFYYNEINNYKNELLRLKKHFMHYQRKPSIAYIPNHKKYLKLKKMLTEIGVECISSKQQLINVINKKLIFIDIDDTLRKSDGTISERVKKAIHDNKQSGNKIVICTARPRYQVLELIKELNIVIFDAERTIMPKKEDLKEKFEQFVSVVNNSMLNMVNPFTICIINGLDKFMNLIQNEKAFSDVQKNADESGIYSFILVETAKKFKSHEFESWHKNYILTDFGIFVGNGIEDQYTIEIGERKRLKNNCGRSFGYVIKNGMPTLIKLIGMKELGDDNE